MDGEVHGFAKSWTRLKRLTHTCFVPPCHSYLVDTIIICGDGALPGMGPLHILF